METFLLTLFISASFGFHVNNRNTIWDSDAPEGAYTYQISLRTFDKHVCSGTIIDENIILTAAYCVSDSLSPFLAVFAGSSKLDNGGDLYKVALIRAHEDYDPYNNKNDIAILKLQDSIKFGQNIRIVELENSNIEGGIDCALSGWGSHSSTLNQLQVKHLQTISNEECALLVGDGEIDSSQICTMTKNGEGLCESEPGSPLVTEKQIGILSFGWSCGLGYPNVYTRVSSFQDWIDQNKF